MSVNQFTHTKMYLTATEAALIGKLRNVGYDLEILECSCGRWTGEQVTVDEICPFCGELFRSVKYLKID